MLKRFIRLPKAIKAAWHWSRALDFNAEGDADAALLELDAMPISGALRCECLILRAVSLSEKSEARESNILCDQALTGLKSMNYSEDEKNYISSYLVWLKYRNHGQLQSPDDLTYELKRLELLLESTRLQAVPKHWLLNFPLRIHPDWKELN